MCAHVCSCASASMLSNLSGALSRHHIRPPKYLLQTVRSPVRRSYCVGHLQTHRPSQAGGGRYGTAKKLSAASTSTTHISSLTAFRDCTPTEPHILWTWLVRHVMSENHRYRDIILGMVLRRFATYRSFSRSYVCVFTQPCIQYRSTQRTHPANRFVMYLTINTRRAA